MSGVHRLFCSLATLSELTPLCHVMCAALVPGSSSSSRNRINDVVNAEEGGRECTPVVYLLRNHVADELHDAPSPGSSTCPDFPYASIAVSTQDRTSVNSVRKTVVGYLHVCFDLQYFLWVCTAITTSQAE
jgi:hypothetical protein